MHRIRLDPSYYATIAEFQTALRQVIEEEQIPPDATLDIVNTLFRRGFYIKWKNKRTY